VHRLGGLLVAIALVATVGACGSDPDLAGGPASVDPAGGCDWAMAGGNLSRTHSTACDTEDAIGADTLDRLEQVWFTETRAEVTGAPAVTDDALYFGDWSGRIYAADRATGKVLWTRDTPVLPNVYAGQITASPTVAELDGEPVLVIASGRTVWVLRTDDGTVVWHRRLGTGGEHPTEIEGSPAVADGLVVVPTDVHNDTSHRSGLVALSLADGAPRWTWDPEAGKPPGGCGSIWGTPSVDLAKRLVVVGTGSCFRQTSWTRYTEAVVGLDLDSGRPRWSFQPRDRVNSQDWDFAGAPNLFDIGDRSVAGLGSKDGSYYVVDRTTGELVWQAEAVRQVEDEGGFAFGGFIGATTVGEDRSGRLVVAGGTAIGDCPCEHAFDAATGKALWQSPEPGGTYGASGSAGGLAFNAGIDQTLRAFDLATGKIRWEHQLESISASGPSIAGDLLAIGVGFREPGTPAAPSGGVQAFRVLARGEEPPSTTTTTLPRGPAITALRPAPQACVDEACDLDFTLKDPPDGRTPKVTLRIDTDPLAITLTTSGLGPPEDWLAADGPAHDDGATVYALFMTPRDDKPELGSVLCIVGDDGTCTTDRIRLPADRFTRISLLALADGDTLPTVQEGFDRLVTTHSFDPALVPST
jgi:polyvinyl alcohol dehydrogenase (cytochrome)